MMSLSLLLQTSHMISYTCYSHSNGHMVTLLQQNIVEVSRIMMLYNMLNIY